ncbi:hypothetical protein MUY14_29255 [Amycolatopsis sp. FBCC-B4732]|uniref:hypothetical protein n=1 Tax=Amycolatopsis sp. FBCC-B4732 TaxID=3079339 RepID=UPI001FF3820B|nr:hypothetical protein [Amycolatopsis sp. FBCC-B4732]UOX85852.1 hypothetical protein MUY14_29255 [Amycolatopsis sp. FBCC-B4732]
MVEHGFGHGRAGDEHADRGQRRDFGQQHPAGELELVGGREPRSTVGKYKDDLGRKETAGRSPAIEDRFKIIAIEPARF